MGRTKKSIQLDRWVKRNQLKHPCKCGCGYAIEVKREHHKKSVGIPDFIPGHNLPMTPEEIQEAVTHKESSWDHLDPEERERRLSMLKSFPRGEDNPSWKGGRRVDEHGYIQVIVPDHPFAKDGYVAEHRLVVEERTKREDINHPLLVEVNGEKYLKPSAVVHHIDEVKSNNEESNLMLLVDQSFHAFIHKSPLPMEERLRRIALGICHSGPLEDKDENG